MDYLHMPQENQKKWRRYNSFYIALSELFLSSISIIIMVAITPYQTAQASFIDRLSLSRPLVLKWQYETSDIAELAPHIYKDSVVVPLSKGNLISLHLHDGNLRWRAEVGGEITAAPLAEGQEVYVASTENPPEEKSGSVSPIGVLRALGQESGITNWITKLPVPLRGVLAANETSIFGCTDDGRTFAVRKADGRVTWVRKSARALKMTLLISTDRLFLGGDDGTVSALDQSTGAILWSYKTGGIISSNMALIGRTVCVGSADNYAYALSSNDGRLLWRRRMSSKIQSVVSTQRGFLVTSTDNFVYLLSPLRGNRYWKRLLPGRVTAPPVATAEGALFAPLSGDECVILDLKDGKKVNVVYVGDGNNTSAAPLISGGVLILTTRKGLLALTGAINQ
jgi:outer membrane protein assembly factor BamB